MKEQIVDVRGKPCPQPVVETRKVLDAGDCGLVRVIVDNTASSENVSRLARKMNCDVTIDKKLDNEIHLLIHPVGVEVPAIPQDQGGASPQPAARMAPRPTQTVVLISSSELGVGEKELGGILMRAFIKTLKEVSPPPTAIIFMNSGVFLTTEGSQLLEDLQDLAHEGIEILSCGTCLDYYKLKGKLEIGTVSNMFEIVSLMADADRVLRP